MSIEAEVLERLEALGIAHYVTGSWALAIYAEPRMTRAVDVVLDIEFGEYESRIRPAFEGDFLVNDPLEWSGGASELQLRDAGSIARLAPDLDWPYIERYAGDLGIADRLEAVRAG